MTTPTDRGPDTPGRLPGSREATAPGLPRRTSTVQILRAAERVFAARGFGGATMAAIAEAAGLPKANLHYYFRAKELLYRAVLEDILAGWLGDAESWISPDRSAQDGLAGYVRTKIAWTRSRPEASRIFAGELLAGAPHIRHFLAYELRAHVVRLEQVFAQWAREGQMQPVRAPHLLFCIWAMTQSYADFAPQMEAVLGRPAGLRDDDYDEAVHMILRLVLGGCAVADARRG